jgi:DNA-binding CsgD family transcriptional regulator
LRLLAEGISNKEVARRLDVTIATIQAHRASIMRKLDVRSIAGLVRYAVRNKIIEP